MDRRKLFWLMGSILCVGSLMFLCNSVSAQLYGNCCYIKKDEDSDDTFIPHGSHQDVQWEFWCDWDMKNINWRDCTDSEVGQNGHVETDCTQRNETCTKLFCRGMEEDHYGHTVIPGEHTVCHYW